jgi:hypothetical protein
MQGLLRLIGHQNFVINRPVMASDGKVVVNTDCVSGVVGV